MQIDKSSVYTARLYLQKLRLTEQIAGAVHNDQRRAVADQSDEVEISSEAEALLRAVTSLQTGQDTAQLEKVARLKEAIAKGVYEVPYDELANRMLGKS